MQFKNYEKLRLKSRVSGVHGLLERIDIFILGPLWASLSHKNMSDDNWRRYLMYIKLKKNITSLVYWLYCYNMLIANSAVVQSLLLTLFL